MEWNFVDIIGLWISQYQTGSTNNTFYKSDKDGKGQGGRTKRLAKRGFLHVENVFSPTTQASGFAAGPEFTPDVSSLAFFSLPPRTTPLTYCRGSGAIERVIWIGS